MNDFTIILLSSKLIANQTLYVCIYMLSVHMRGHVSVCPSVCLSLCVHCVCVHVCVSMFVFVCLCVYSCGKIGHVI